MNFTDKAVAAKFKPVGEKDRVITELATRYNGPLSKIDLLTADTVWQKGGTDLLELIVPEKPVAKTVEKPADSK